MNCILQGILQNSKDVHRDIYHLTQKFPISTKELPCGRDDGAAINQEHFKGLACRIVCADGLLANKLEFALLEYASDEIRPSQV